MRLADAVSEALMRFRSDERDAVTVVYTLGGRRRRPGDGGAESA